MEANFKKGTTTVGIVYKDGIILAADKRASAGYLISNKKVDKVIKINDYLAITIAGLVSDAQLLTKLIRAEVKLKELRAGKRISVKEAANLLGTMVYNNIRKFSAVPGIVGFLMAGFDSKGAALYELGVDGSIMDVDDYVSDGSGSIVALGVLESLYKPGLNQEDALELAKKCINAAIQRDLATGNGMNAYTITKDGVKEVLAKKITGNKIE
ncbi:proteasome subunit beta [Candidatus Woesearchaeota archaeon]|nr:proteasome subunit beta [Candidatus Woesearchaeota archaeon]